MDSLWQCVLRHSEGSWSAGGLSAAEDHLESMKKITFRMLKIDV